MDVDTDADPDRDIDPDMDIDPDLELDLDMIITKNNKKHAKTYGFVKHFHVKQPKSNKNT